MIVASIETKNLLKESTSDPNYVGLIDYSRHHTMMLGHTIVFVIQGH